MKKIFKLIYSIATIFIFVACGGSSENSSKSSNTSSIEKISNRDAIAINYHYNKEICTSSYLKNYIMEAMSYLNPKDLIITVQSNSVTCQTYGKINDGKECYESHSNRSYNTSCVTAFNSSSIKNNKLLKMSIANMAKETTEMIDGY